jgi:hypothetical protein
MLEPSPHRFAVPGRVFKAQYPGKCELCGKKFPAGRRIRYIAEKTVAHDACAAVRGPVCDPVLSDERARENMRSHKESTWRRGKSSSSYG